ncbi:hypothetical protein [Bradyrhizobium sp. SZCCHNS2005]|nr:hypothetical protein [Bradyrhizobium sp. SZCCHNS2005]
MVVRRKYRKPLAFKDGGAVPVLDQVPPPVVPPDLEAAPPAPDADTAIAEALKAQRHAEELAKQPPRPPTIEEQIDRIPDISEFKRQTLREFPRLMDPAIIPLASRHYAAALADGVPDDTEEMTHRIVGGVTADLELMERTRAAPPRAEPTLPAPTAPTPVQASPPPAVSRRLPSAPARRAVPVSAPVSREIPTASGQRPAGLNEVRLTSEERQIARNSFGTVGGVQMSNNEKERLYALNKAKYQRMLATGQYGGQS